MWWSLRTQYASGHAWFVLFFSLFFFFNDTATTEIYTLSLHDALPICQVLERECLTDAFAQLVGDDELRKRVRSEEHTSELQSRRDLVCRLLLEKKKTEDSPTRRPNNRSGPPVSARPYAHISIAVRPIR